jgi:hypothetical protein
VRPLSPGARIVVTGVIGDWSAANSEGVSAYVRSDMLCVPTREASQPTALAPPATDEPTPTVHSAPNAQSASSPFKYHAPALVAPTNGETYSCKRDLRLVWQFDAGLGPDEFFLVESKPHEHERWFALADWTKETSVMLHPNRGEGTCDTVWWGNTGIYEWRVSIVRGNKETPIYLSPFSDSSIINYAQ